MVKFEEIYLLTYVPRKIFKQLMNMKQTLLFFFIILYNINVFPQQTFENDSIIYWSEDRKLLWEDFNGEKESEVIINSQNRIVAASKIAIDYINSQKIKIIITSFEKEKSWSTTKSKDVLEHEQLHFDIAELFARKIRKAFVELKNQNITDQSLYNDIYENYIQEWVEYDKEYEKGIFSVNAEKVSTVEGVEYALVESEISEIYNFGQMYWKEKIEKELKELEEYSNPFIK